MYISLSVATVGNDNKITRGVWLPWLTAEAAAAETATAVMAGSSAAETNCGQFLCKRKQNYDAGSECRFVSFLLF